MLSGLFYCDCDCGVDADSARAIGTYSQLIDRYIALTHFARSKIIKGGIADHKVVLKPNFVPDPPAAGNGGGGYVAYVGGLLKSKGTETLVAAWRALPMVKLKIVGDGELRTQCEAIVRQENLNIEFTGMQNRSAVLKIIANAEILIVPSEWYEGFRWLLRSHLRVVHRYSRHVLAAWKN